MTQQRKLILIFSLIAFSLLMGGGTAVYLKRIAVSQWALEKAAIEFGFPEVGFQLDEIELDKVSLSDIWFGEDLKISSVDFRFTPAGLLDGDFGQLTLNGVQIDMSHSQKGALGKVQQRFQADEKEATTSAPQLPEIMVRNMIVTYSNEETVLNAVVDGKIFPDLSAKLYSTGQGRFRDFVMQDMSLTVDVAKGASDIAAILERTTVFHEASEPVFVPVRLSGEGRLKEKDLNFSFSLTDLNKHIELTSEGSFDTQTSTFQAQVNVDEVEFSPEGLQPQQLSSLVKLPITLDAKLSAKADILWENGDLKTDGTLNLTEVTPDLDPKLHLSGQIDFSAYPMRQEVTLTSTNLNLHHIDKNPLFEPVHLTVKASVEKMFATMKVGGALKNRIEHKLFTAMGTHDIENEKGEATITLALLDFSPKGLQPKNVSSRLSILQEAEGKMTARSRLHWHKGKFNSSGVVELDDLSVRSDTVELKKINTKLALSNLWPPRTSKPQRIDLAELYSGLSLGKPTVTFSLRGSSYFIHEFKGQFIDGEIASENILVDPNAKRHALTVKMSHLNLEKLFSLIELEGLKGNGRVTGQLPIAIEDEKVIIENGVLESEGSGVVQFHSEKANQALAGGGEQVELLLKVLSNFHYEKLSLKVNREANSNAMIKLHLEGMNPQVMDARPFNLNINLEGNVDPLLETILEGYRLSDRAIRATVGDE